MEKGFTNDINGFLSVQHTTHFSRHSIRDTIASAGWEIQETSEATTYNGLRLLCVPGPTVVAAGNAEDAHLLDALLDHWQNTAVTIDATLKRLANVERVVIWGGGLHTEVLYHKTTMFKQFPDRTYMIVDTDPVKHGHSWRGISIKSAMELSDIDWSKTKLLISSYGSQSDIKKNATILNVPGQCIACLYDSVNVY